MYLIQRLARDESLSWHPLLTDFILVGQKLEKLGFVYNKSSVIVLDPGEVHENV